MYTYKHTHTNKQTHGWSFFHNSHVLFYLAQLAYLLDVSCMYDVRYDDISIEINKRSYW